MKINLQFNGGRNMYSFEEVKEFDPEIAAAISDELGSIFFL